MKRASVLQMIVVGALLFACEDDRPVLTPYAAPPTNVAALDFGAVACGQVTTRTLRIPVNEPIDDWRIVSLEPARYFDVDHDVARRVSRAGYAQIPLRVISTDGLRPGEAAVGHARIALRTGASERVVDVALTFEAQGAWLEATSVVDFGGVPFASAPTRTWSVRNTGNAPATITPSLDQASSFRVDSARRVVKPNGAAAWSLDFVARDASEHESALSVVVDGPVCSPPISSVRVRAKRTGDRLATSTGTLDFGAMSCAGERRVLPIALDNHGDKPIHWSAAITDGNGFELLQNAGDVAPGTTGYLEVAATSFASDAVFAPGGVKISSDVGTIDVSLLRRLSGARVRWPSSPLDLGRVRFGATVDGTAQLENAGDRALTVALTAGPEASTPTATITVPPASAVPIPVSLAPKGLTKTASTIALTTEDDAPRCTPLTALDVSAFAFTRATRTQGNGYNVVAIIDGGRVALVQKRYDPVTPPFEIRLLDGTARATMPIMARYSYGYWNAETCVRVDNPSSTTCFYSNDAYGPMLVDEGAAFEFTDDQLQCLAFGPDKAVRCRLRNYGPPPPYAERANTLGVTRFASSGPSRACILHEGKVECWGRYDYPETTFDTRRTLSFSNGVDLSDYGVLQADGRVVRLTWDQTPTTVTGLTDGVALVSGAPCVVRANHRVACWGGKADEPFLSVDAAYDVGLTDVAEASFIHVRHLDGTMRVGGSIVSMASEPLTPGFD